MLFLLIFISELFSEPLYAKTALDDEKINPLIFPKLTYASYCLLN